MIQSGLKAVPALQLTESRLALPSPTRVPKGRGSHKGLMLLGTPPAWVRLYDGRFAPVWSHAHINSKSQERDQRSGYGV
jgi:hypothetical protein